MTTVRASTKGQVVIPRDLRRRLGIEAGTILGVSERRGSLVLRPLRDVPQLEAIDRACGLLAGANLVGALLAERRRERTREKKKTRRAR
ncbi:MAG: AbrB/MazE/SpoVT family DNA-binding domain-containing protein [Myxococcales bacterium]|nr:AbrB/MazE/SpoVT family DNA-binding domain-containing protein [Myxococcales bacterium]